ncbi:hypothetical protein CCACVL1_03340 [Corchorus capsularis]|uniref:Uncharacterized protein n=1 Tax=Corchorus capsularis TaxID=210143 RepID=A0A1R3K077_COCAP|nr:hypothetical protein CCACVL1_03340 [Corchorus capsularis]
MGLERPEITSVLNELKTSQWTNLIKIIIVRPEAIGRKALWFGKSKTIQNSTNGPRKARNNKCSE